MKWLKRLRTGLALIGIVEEAITLWPAVRASIKRVWPEWASATPELQRFVELVEQARRLVRGKDTI
jgi:hypothetical protein